MFTVLFSAASHGTKRIYKMRTIRKYNTKQKDEILKCISSFGEEHFTAADVVARLNNLGNTIGQATVYRMIERLAEA